MANKAGLLTLLKGQKSMPSSRIPRPMYVQKNASAIRPQHDTTVYVLPNRIRIY
jgi:hypothetical protein